MARIDLYNEGNLSLNDSFAIIDPESGEPLNIITGEQLVEFVLNNLPVVTSNRAGLMTSELYDKLNGIEDQAERNNFGEGFVQDGIVPTVDINTFGEILTGLLEESGFSNTVQTVNIGAIESNDRVQFFSLSNITDGVATILPEGSPFSSVNRIHVSRNIKEIVETENGFDHMPSDVDFFEEFPEDTTFPIFILYNLAIGYGYFTAEIDRSNDDFYILNVYNRHIDVFGIIPQSSIFIKNTENYNITGILRSESISNKLVPSPLTINSTNISSTLPIIAPNLANVEEVEVLPSNQIDNIFYVVKQ